MQVGTDYLGTAWSDLTLLRMFPIQLVWYIGSSIYTRDGVMK